MDTTSMLDEAIRYVKFLKGQILVLQRSDNQQPPWQVAPPNKHRYIPELINTDGLVVMKPEKACLSDSLSRNKAIEIIALSAYNIYMVMSGLRIMENMLHELSAPNSFITFLIPRSEGTWHCVRDIDGVGDFKREGWCAMV
ncbi:hypothetical protein V6N13_087912 [Hibiscus sabdariffa]|uniref:BHLH domain-containing protein n=1 Tax=Hibiscus sabdariffa TaxID=183260 RepID=A0ABR2FYK1_9ROSI